MLDHDDLRRNGAVGSWLGNRYRVRANTELDLRAVGDRGFPIQGEHRSGGCSDHQTRSRPQMIDNCRDEIHPRLPEETCDEAVGRLLVELQRRAVLLDPALVEDDDAVGQRHRLDLIMRHIDHGGLQPLVQPCDLDAHLGPEAGVEVRERLVEQEDVGLADDGAADGDALALPARKLLRLAAEQLFDLQHAGGFRDLAVDLGLVCAQHLERKAHILGHRHMRVERVGLEHHGDAAIRGRHRVHRLAADQQLAGGDLLQPGDHAQQGGLAAAGRADEDDQLAVLDGERDVADGLDPAEGFGDVLEFYGSQLLNPST